MIGDDTEILRLQTGHQGADFLHLVEREREESEGMLGDGNR